MSGPQKTNTAWKYSQDASALRGATWQTATTPGKRPSKAGQSAVGLAATAGLQKQRPLFPFSSPVSKLMTPFPPRNQGKASFGSLLQPRAFHPHDTHCLPTHRVCPHTFTISFKEGFRYLVVLHRGQPWSSIVPSFVRTPRRRLHHSQSPPRPLRTDTKQVPTNKHWAEAVPSWRSTGREEALQHKRSGCEFSGPAEEPRS